MYFDIIARDTPAEGAKLVFRRIAAQFKCCECGNTYDKPLKGFDCPKCGGMGLPTGIGHEFYIDSIEVE
jgi:hydrogenase nickel incorporation protein HypA/HybF